MYGKVIAVVPVGHVMAVHVGQLATVGPSSHTCDSGFNVTLGQVLVASKEQSCHHDLAQKHCRYCICIVQLCGYKQAQCKTSPALRTPCTTAAVSIGLLLKVPVLLM